MPFLTYQQKSKSLTTGCMGSALGKPAHLYMACVSKVWYSSYQEEFVNTYKKVQMDSPFDHTIHLQNSIP